MCVAGSNPCAARHGCAEVQPPRHDGCLALQGIHRSRASMSVDYTAMLDYVFGVVFIAMTLVVR